MKPMHVQGDVAVIPVKLPSSTTTATKGAEILALGEHSGHGHVAEECDILIGADEAKYLIPKKDARILHKHLLDNREADHRAIASIDCAAWLTVEEMVDEIVEAALDTSQFDNQAIVVNLERTRARLTAAIEAKKQKP